MMPRICIDPGHGGADPGAVGSRMLKEADLALAISKEIIFQLSQRGIDGFLTRETDEYVALHERVDRGKGALCLVSIHCNAAINPAANGTETIHSGGKSKALANYLQQAMTRWVGLRSRGLKLSPSKEIPARLYMVTVPEIPAVILELGFITNDDDAAVLSSVDGQKRMAHAVAIGVESYLASQGISVSEQAPTFPPDYVADEAVFPNAEPQTAEPGPEPEDEEPREVRKAKSPPRKKKAGKSRRSNR